MFFGSIQSPDSRIINKQILSVFAFLVAYSSAVQSRSFRSVLLNRVRPKIKKENIKKKKEEKRKKKNSSGQERNEYALE